MSKIQTVQEYLAYLSPKNKDLINKLRTLIKRAFPDTVEQINPWGSLTVSVKRKEIVWFGDYSNHVNLEFFQGAKLHPPPLLEGTGKNFRHIKIQSEDDIKEKEFTRLLKEAVKLSL